jgi:thioredoxin-like negative regulator of GroEL
VVSAADALSIETARREHPGNHLLLAVLMANVGDLDDAAAELDALAATDSQTAHALRESLDQLRKR